MLNVDKQRLVDQANNTFERRKCITELGEEEIIGELEKKDQAAGKTNNNIRITAQTEEEPGRKNNSCTTNKKRTTGTSQ